MAVEIRKRTGESSNAALYRFTKRVKQSGVLIETKKRRFTNRPKNKTKRRSSAIYRAVKRVEMERAKKLGVV